MGQYHQDVEHYSFFPKIRARLAAMERPNRRSKERPDSMGQDLRLWKGGKSIPKEDSIMGWR